MKTKKLLFSLVLLFLGTATAWADKYYMPKSYRNKVNPRLTLENAVGKRFMIYNTAIDTGTDENGNTIYGVDKTGFLRNGGAEFAHDKSKERDLFIYNESFVYTLEKHTDDTGTWYAIKSLSTGTYVDCNGKTTHHNAADAKLNIYNWSEAKSKGITAWTGMECWEYNIVANRDIEHQSVVFVIGGKYTVNGKDLTAYWSGGTTSFGTDEWIGHPYVFYEALEFTDESQSAVKADKPFLQDLHAYSRCDMYSSQRAYGLVHVHDHDDNTHITIPGRQESAHGIHLNDGDILTSVDLEAGESLQLQFNNGEAPSAVHIYLQRNADKTNVPTSINVEASNDGKAWETVATSLEVNLNPHCATDAIEFGVTVAGDAQTYSYLRISDANGKAMSLSEVYIFPHGNDGVLHTLNEYLATIAALDNEIHTKASAQVYADTIEEYNENYAAVKLLSGIPYAGNKYRIHADVFSHNEHEKLQIGVDGNSIKLGGDYFSAADKTIYEWYSERLSDGSLAFKNVKTGRYLALGMTTSETPVGWNINTSLTQRTGVPLRNAGYPLTDTNYYLAVRNDGTGLGRSETIHNQLSSEYCTDFVFMPVDISDNEKKITIKANELVMRNTELKYNGTVYSMPFSQMFIKEGENEPVLPELELQCPVIHPFVGVKVNGVAKENIATQVEKNGVKVLEFNWDNIENGDVLELVFEIETPFEITPTATGAKPQLYFIRNKRPYGLQPQQARPNRAADANIGIEGDGPISVVGDKFDYAKFDSRGTEIHLVQDKKDNPTSLDATSLFYFTQTESNDPARYYSVNVNNVTTVMKFATTGTWDNNGGIWYVQPDYNGAYSGYNIGATKLNATNNPADAWCDAENADIISFSTPDDDGTAWEFVPVSDNDAKKLLKEFIDKVATELLAKFSKISTEIATERGYDMEKVGYYKYMVEELVNRVGNAGDGGYYDTGDIFKLVQYAQNIHMIEHEVVYALYELPLLSDETRMDDEAGFANPKWYYVRNVAGNNYAAYTSADHPMNLEQNPTGTYPDGGMLLKNMFYFAGYKNVFDTDADNNPETTTGYKDYPGNNLILDEYLKIHLHNFMAKRNTLVSRNDTVVNYNGYPGYNIQKITDITGGLSSSDNWTIEAEYLLDGSSFNAYGSCLMSSQKDALADYFPNAFQVYFKDNRTIVLKINDLYDTKIYDHTQEFYSKIKVVVTYSFGKLTIDIYNSAGEKESWSDYVQLNPISALYSAFPANGGIKIENLVVKKVETMNWTEHSDTNNNDLWYIFPSSNLNNVGFAITLDGPNEYNQGWTNASDTVDTAPGYEDNSTWKFERVTDFDDHINELLDLYNLEDCVIYNKELAALMKLIIKNKALIETDVNGEGEEAWFNEVYYAIINYNGPMPDELKAPKPGKFYTIFPASDVEEVEMCVHVDEAANEISTNEVNRTTKIVTYYQGHDEYNSRGVWYFEGTPEADGFLPNTGLKLKNLHTLTSLNELGAQGALLTEGGALDVTLEKQGATMVAIRTNGNNMARGDVAAKSIINASTTRTFATDKATITFDWYELNTHVNGNTGEISKDDINTAVVKTDKGSVAFSTSHSIMARLHEGEQIEYNTICTFANANTSPTIEHTFTLSDLGDSFTFNHIALDIHAFNAARKYQANGDNVLRQWNVKAQVSNGNGEFTDFFTLADIDIAAGVGTAGDVHQKWGLAGNEFTTTTGTLVVKLTITKGSENQGCFFGLSEVALSNVGDVWYIEEIKEPEYIYHKTSTNQNGHSTLMLGFPAQIPTEVEAFYASSHHNMIDGRYLRMVSYDEAVLPAKTPVVLRNRDYANNSKNIEGIKFYYRKDAVEALNGNYLYGSLYRTLVECASFNGKDVDGDGVEESDVNIYMLQTNKSDVKMYWVYENYREDGTKTGDNDNGGYVLCKANKAYMVLPSDKAGTTSSYSFRFDANTTGIDEVEGENEELKGEGEEVESIYDLQGRKLTEISHPGVYIVNGKKIIVK